MAWLCFPLWFVNTHTRTCTYTHKPTHTSCLVSVGLVVINAWNIVGSHTGSLGLLSSSPNFSSDTDSPAHLLTTDLTSNSFFVNHRHSNNSCFAASIVCFLVWVWRPSVGGSFSLVWYSGSSSDSDNQTCIIVYADLRGRVAGGRGGDKVLLSSCWKKQMFRWVWHEKPDTSWPFLHITRYVLNVECHVTFVLTGVPCKHTLISTIC